MAAAADLGGPPEESGPREARQSSAGSDWSWRCDGLPVYFVKLLLYCLGFCFLSLWGLFCSRWNSMRVLTLNTRVKHKG